MRKCFVLMLIPILLFSSLDLEVNAHCKKLHDQCMSNVLFGTENYKKTLSKSSEQYEALEALENAVAICVDQYNSSYNEKLEKLNKMRIHGIPETIDEINFTENSRHRRFTHRGWNYVYTKGPDKWEEKTNGGDWNENWRIRKTILLQTVNKVFGFQRKAGEWKILWFKKDYGYDKQCEAFAELLYYIHILDDISKSGMNEGYSDMIKLALAHPQKDSPDIYQELLTLLPKLLKSQVGKKAYSGFIVNIKDEAKDARKFVAENPELNTCYFTYKDFAKNLLDMLKDNIPNFLKRESYFKDVFY